MRSLEPADIALAATIMMFALLLVSMPDGTELGREPINLQGVRVAFFGLISMGFGVLLALIRERQVIARNQHAKSVLDLTTRDSQSPLERIGLAPGDGRMIMATISGLCFLAGCAVGFFLLLAT
jgi:hypothetical protein